LFPDRLLGVQPLKGLPHFAPKAKRIIYLFMSGAPSQLDTFDYKPTMVNLFDQDLPDSIRMGQRLTTMTSGQNRFPVAPSIYKFSQHGRSGVGERVLPHLATWWTVALVKTVGPRHQPRSGHLHPPATSCPAGEPQDWLAYGLGGQNQDLPAYGDDRARTVQARRLAPSPASGRFLSRLPKVSACAASATRCSTCNPDSVSGHSAADARRPSGLNQRSTS
jgi:hypothetical protein